MEKLTIDQMENLVGLSYCGDLHTMIFGGNFQGSDELFGQAFYWCDTRCREYKPRKK